MHGEADVITETDPDDDVLGHDGLAVGTTAAGGCGEDGVTIGDVGVTRGQESTFDAFPQIYPQSVKLIAGDPTDPAA